MTLPALTLWRYIAGRYLVQLALIAVSLLSIVWLFETFELMRRASGKDIPIFTILMMAVTKLPETAQIVMPFIFLLGGLALFWQLNRSSELVVMRASGISAWQFVAPVMVTAFLLGLLNISVVQPIGAASLKRFAALESQHLGTPRRITALNEQGLWVRDEEAGGQARLMHTQSIDMATGALGQLIILEIDDQGRFTKRYDASGGVYDNEEWRLGAGRETFAAGQSLPFTNKVVGTGISRTSLLSGFTDTQTFSFWSLPGRIAALAASGFPTRSLILYYQNLLATPFLWMAMALIAVAVSLTPHRMGRAVLMLGIGVIAGFFYFMFARYFEALTLTQRIPEILAAWVPVLLGLLIPFASLLQTEDG